MNSKSRMNLPGCRVENEIKSIKIIIKSFACDSVDTSKHSN